MVSGDEHGGRLVAARGTAGVLLAAAVLVACAWPSLDARYAGPHSVQVVVDVAHRTPLGYQPPAFVPRPAIEGFADRASVATGHRVTLYVSTRAARFTVHALRYGWYGGGDVREVWRSAPQPGRQQAPPRLVARATNTWDAPWQPSLTIRTLRWPAGAYLLRLDAAGGGHAYVPLTVRGAPATGRVVLVSPVTTWQAYNEWGCCSLYVGGLGHTFRDRSRAVSFDRPYLARLGASDFVAAELGVVVEAERLHLPLSYLTDVDLQTDPHALDGARAVITLGHDEYWSPRMRAVLTAARDRGANLAFLGANAVFRRVRFAATSLGPDRLEIDYKIAAEDPLLGHDNAAVTADWPSGPVPRPESTLVGARYLCFFGVGRPSMSARVADAGSWILAGTGAGRGDALPGLLGPEVDAAVRGRLGPGVPVDVLLHSAVRCKNGRRYFADSTYYVAPSGAGVFDTGTMLWTCQLERACARPVFPVTRAFVRRVTDTVLSRFATGPAGRGGG